MGFDLNRTVTLSGRDSTAVMTSATIDATSSLSPCAAVAVCEGDSIGAVSIYVRSPQGDLGAVEVEVRVRYGGDDAEPVVSLPLPKLATGSPGGSVLHLSGRRCIGVELWARHGGTERVRCSVLFVVARGDTAVPWFAEPGSLA